MTSDELIKLTKEMQAIGVEHFTIGDAFVKFFGRSPVLPQKPQGKTEPPQTFDGMDLETLLHSA